ncbi:hypothetical protein BHE74_00002375 [Ensete ventricosum]|nr:hypothetical protein BHE74_00002375 [Ensete ventricosum]
MRLLAFVAAIGEEETRRVRRGTTVAVVDDSGCDCDKGGRGSNEGTSMAEGAVGSGYDINGSGGDEEGWPAARAGVTEESLAVAEATTIEEGLTAREKEAAGSSDEWLSELAEEVAVRAGSNDSGGLHGGDGEDNNGADGWQRR